MTIFFELSVIRFVDLPVGLLLQSALGKSIESHLPLNTKIFIQVATAVHDKLKYVSWEIFSQLRV